MQEKTSSTGKLSIGPSGSQSGADAGLDSAQTRKPQAVPVSRPRLWLWIAGLALAALAGAVLYFQPWATKAVEVSVETVIPAPVTRVLAVNGRIAALQSVDIRPLVSGTLAEILVDEGEIVAAGHELARIDSNSQQAIVRQALASLDAALVAKDEAQANYERMIALGTNAAKNELDNAFRAVQRAEHETERMTALLDQAHIQLGNFVVRAPIGGTVLVLNADQGQIVDPSSLLMTVASLDQLVVETDVDETYATQIRKGQPVALQLAGETENRAGKVSFVSQRVDSATGGLAVKIAFDEPAVAPIGLTVTANIVVDEQRAALTVPRAAIISDNGGPAVFVVEDGRAVGRKLTVQEWPAARLIVTEGLAEGDVVIADATGIVAGQAVVVAQP